MKIKASTFLILLGFFPDNLSSDDFFSNLLLLLLLLFLLLFKLAKIS